MTTLVAMKLLRLVLTVVCIVATQPTAADLQLLQGTWEGVVLSDKSRDKITITITGNSLRFHRDANFWFETAIALPAGTDPKQLHATIKGCAQACSIGTVVGAIFKIEDGTLTLATTGDGAEETPKAFEAPEDRGLVRYELRRMPLKTRSSIVTDVSTHILPTLPPAAPPDRGETVQRPHGPT